MRIPSLFALVALTAPAAAQPITSPASCAVTISRAPEDVREVVEAWVRAEPRCASSLDIRIIATDGGLYLLAQDEDGGVRERIVPDAQSAGVLIASWVADDTFPPDKTVVFVPELAPPSSARLAALRPTSSPTNGVDAMPTATASRKLDKWLSLGLMFHSGDGRGGGLRAEADVMTWASWSLGLAISKTAWGSEFYERAPQSEERFHLDEIKAVAYIARTVRSDRFSLRAAAGAGVMWTRAQGFVNRPLNGFAGETWMLDESGTFAAVEGSLLATLKLGKWGVQAGPVLTAHAQRFTVEQQHVWEPMNLVYSRPLLDLHFLTGLRRTL